MKRTLLTGNGAAAWGARLAQVDYVPAFPITPQTEIIETLAAWIDQGEMAGRLVTLESEHSMLTAAAAAAATGVRVFTATSSQGLLYGMEMIYTVAGWRAPFVLVNSPGGWPPPYAGAGSQRRPGRPGQRFPANSLRHLPGGPGQHPHGLFIGRGPPGAPPGPGQPGRLLSLFYPGTGGDPGRGRGPGVCRAL